MDAISKLMSGVTFRNAVTKMNITLCGVVSLVITYRVTGISMDKISVLEIIKFSTIFITNAVMVRWFTQVVTSIFDRSTITIKSNTYEISDTIKSMSNTRNGEIIQIVVRKLTDNEYNSYGSNVAAIFIHGKLSNNEEETFVYYAYKVDKGFIGINAIFVSPENKEDSL